MFSSLKALCEVVFVLHPASGRSCSKSYVFVETVIVCGAVDLYCATIRSVWSILFTLFISEDTKY